MPVLPRLAVLACFAASLGTQLAHAQSASPQEDKLERVIDRMEQLSGGPYPGQRANHAKGMVLLGQFIPAEGAAELSRAEHWQGKARDVVVRVSDGGGMPTIPDANPNATPRGLSIRFLLDHGDWTDIVALSSPTFPVGNADDFLALLDAAAASGPGAGKPAPIEKFFAAHPAALRSIKAYQTTPSSLAGMPFFGVNAFLFTNAKGESRYGRYIITPLNPSADLSPAEARQAGPNYLFEDMMATLKRGPVRYRIAVQLAGPGDVVEDCTVAWPASRPQIVVGDLMLTSPDTEDADRRRLAYNPLKLVDGIAPSKDPILLARGKSYPISVSRRLND